MNLSVVIIGMNEGRYICDMLSALQRDLPDAERIWILDRCSDPSEVLLTEYGEKFICTEATLKGRQTSYCRNLGLSQCKKENDVIFIDGDRFPKVGSLRYLQEWKEDIALIPIEDDVRIYVEYENYYGTVNNLFYSAGLFIKRPAIEKIKSFQKGFLFNEDIQQDWGIEDTYLGDVAYHLRLTCDVYLPVRLRGRFAKNKLDSMDVLEKRLKLRQKLNVKW